MGFREAYGILEALGEGEGLLRQLARPLALAADFIILPQSNQYLKKLRRVAELLTQRVRPDTDTFIVRGRLALGQAHRLTEGDDQVELVPGTPRGVRELTKGGF